MPPRHSISARHGAPTVAKLSSGRRAVHARTVEPSRTSNAAQPTLYVTSSGSTTGHVVDPQQGIVHRSIPSNGAQSPEEQSSSPLHSSK